MDTCDNQPENDSNYEQRLAKICATDAVDAKFGYYTCKDSTERDAWLVNVQSSEAVDEQTKVIYAACDFYFLQIDGERFKISYPFRPYLYLDVVPSSEFQVSSYLAKKYSGIVITDIVEKEDLDLKNHLSGLKKKYIKVSFPSMSELQKFKREITPLMKQNQERQKNSTSYTTLLSKHFGSGMDCSDDGEAYEKIIDMREHDITYHMRVCIDKRIFVGSWYKVIGRGVDRLPSIVPHPTLIDHPEPVVLAYDIEVTKLPLKFPDSAIDEIVMISYMIDGHGFLITNRQIVSADIEDFEYTPRPEFPGKFKVFNEDDEAGVIKCFFDHILRVRPSIFVTFNGDSFDWPFVEARAAFHGLEMCREIGFSKDASGEYKSSNAVHMDAYRWVKRDSYLPVGSQNLKACTRAKLRYDPVELDPEVMCSMAKEDPQTLASYSVSDAVATYYLYMKYVHPFVFALCTIIPLGPDDVLRKGSGTLCEALLMVEAFHRNIIFPNKQVQTTNKFTSDGHMIESETYVGGHVEALESGVFRADLPERFRIVPSVIFELKKNVKKTLGNAITEEMHIDLNNITDFNEVCEQVVSQLDDFIKRPLRLECPKIYHLDVGAMYPNIILTNRLQPPAVVSEEDCIACIHNIPDAKCRRMMRWEWRGEIIPATKGEYDRILQQLETEKFGKPPKPYHALSNELRKQIEKKRIQDFCKRAYGKFHISRSEFRHTAICELENGFYVNTVRAFRDRRYEYKGLLKKAKAALSALPDDDVAGIKKAQNRIIFYDSLQLAHKCILNSFYGYVMRKGSRWFSMEMAGIVCHTGANIITEARKLVEKIGKPLELDTDGIWCLIPSSFPENVTFTLKDTQNKKVVVSYPGAMLNELVREKFTNNQYHELQEDGSFLIKSENSIFFEVDGPYLAMILPASKEEGKKLKKRYAVFNFDKTLAELKGFEMKRRGELAIIKYFQTAVFKAFLYGKNHEECYAHVAKEADHWLNVLFTKGANLSDSELFDLISENRSMSKKLDDYEGQKSTSISTAKRLAEFLGDDMVKDAGLACQFIISRKPVGFPVTERAIPVAIFQASPEVTAHYLRKWTKDHDITKEKINIRDIIDWEYYLERVGGTIQKIVSIPAALQNVPNPVPRIPLPDWLENKLRQRDNDHMQPKITDIFKPCVEKISSVSDIENIALKSAESNRPSCDAVLQDSSNLINRVFPRKRQRNLSGAQNVSNSSCNAIPGKRFCEEELVKKTIVKDGVIAWIRHNKKKEAGRVTRLKHFNLVEAVLEAERQKFLATQWHIVAELTHPGILSVLAVVNNRMTKFFLRVPRIFYVNNRQPTKQGVAVKKVLPRMKQSYNLYKYSVDDSRFQARLDDVNRELCSMNVEGVYETQISLTFRVLLELGSCWRLKNDIESAFAIKPIPLENFEMVPEASYLGNNLFRKVFLYEHHQDTRCVISLFNENENEAIIVIVNKTRLELPNLGTIYSTEKKKLQHIFSLQRGNLFPTFVNVLSNESKDSLIRRIPVLSEFPMIKIHCIEPPDFLNTLEWQRIVCKRIVQHYFNSLTYFNDYLEISRYLHLPIGNLPHDWRVFGCDLLYARNLYRSGYVLWASPMSRPDLGGKEFDDYRIGTDWQNLRITEQPKAIYNKESFETDICVELELGAVAVTAIIQSARIIEAEGGVDSTGFISANTLASDSLLGRVKSIAHYDEAAAISGAVKVLRHFLQDCIRDIHIYGSKIADQIVMNTYRWLLSTTSLLYDPAIARGVDILITKLCLLLVAEINRLGGKVLYVSRSQLFISTQRRDGAEAFVTSLIQSLGKNQIFAALHIVPVHYWNVFLWLDCKNYAGIQFGKNEGDRTAVCKMNIAKKFPEEMNCQETFLVVVLGYMELVARRIKAKDSDEELAKFRKQVVSTELSDQMFNICSRLSSGGQRLIMSKFIPFNVERNDVSVLFAKSVLKLISLDDAVYAEVEKLRYQLFRLLEVSDDSTLAECIQVELSCCIPQMFCISCGQSNDLEGCQEEPWVCESCKTVYSSANVEHVLLERVNQLVLAYTLQDLQCKRCGATKRDMLSEFCECSGPYKNMIEKEELEFNIRVLMGIAETHKFNLLKEACEWVLA
uniref:DNA polymerase epsilon catalytic subunit n=1 Tax=Syphacia muris TaxID=451379 RepID=A0A0N5A8U1_9BILA